MPRPQIVVNVTSTPVRRGADSPTGTAFMAYTAATGPAGPVAVTSPAAAVAAGIPQAVVDYISDCLTLGAPRVVAVRATAAGADATLAEWTAALEQMEDTYGMGQVMIPGVATTAAHDALLAHANTTGRTVLLDGETDATATEARGRGRGPGQRPRRRTRRPHRTLDGHARHRRRHPHPTRVGSRGRSRSPRGRHRRARQSRPRRRQGPPGRARQRRHGSHRTFHQRRASTPSRTPASR